MEETNEVTKEELESKEEVNQVENNENEKIKQELDEVNDRLKRIMAEFENYKKRSSKEKEQQYTYILGDVVSSLLPVLDNLDKAVTVETQDTQYKQGVELVLKQFQDVLSTFGVKKIEAVGNPFDPELHDAVSHVEDESLGEQIVKEEYKAGYRIGDKVIRHSMVVVAN
ncbi:MAG: nucleotide exchange factor GrpE [Clostridia bacterium]|nr:nucleotide exchange factor GrpE [Clostridia bacterium]